MEPSRGARINWNQLLQNGEGVVHPVETHLPDDHMARIDRADPGPMNRLLVVSSQRVPTTLQVELVRRDNPVQAYVRSDGVEIQLNHNRGVVFFAMICHRVDDGVYSIPDPEDVKEVAVKRLHKDIIDPYVERGGQENPYCEAYRLQNGDNLFTLRSVEILEDDKFLYLITPRACELGTLAEQINWDQPNQVMPQHRIHQIFKKILQILGHLERNGISHRDLKPHNFLFLAPDNLVVFDMAMSVRMPFNPTTGLRTVQPASNPGGTLPYMAPEVFFSRLRDGVAVDLWSASVILYNMATNLLLYRLPHPSDRGFVSFVVRQDLGNAQNLPPPTANFLQSVLQVNPANRITLGQAMESDFV